MKSYLSDYILLGRRLQLAFSLPNFGREVSRAFENIFILCAYGSNQTRNRCVSAVELLRLLQVPLYCRSCAVIDYRQAAGVVDTEAYLDGRRSKSPFVRFVQVIKCLSARHKI